MHSRIEGAMLQTRPQLENHSAKPGRVYCPSAFPTSPRCSSTNPAATKHRGAFPRHLAPITPLEHHQLGDRPANNKATRSGAWIPKTLSPCVCREFNTVETSTLSIVRQSDGHGLVDAAQQWADLGRCQAGSARKPLMVRFSRCYQSEQRMRSSPAAGQGPRAQRRSAHPPWS